MGFLDKVERGLEKVVTSFFRGASTSDIQPVELTTALRNEMDRKILAISEGRSLAPNSFTVYLSEKDFRTAKSWGSAVNAELAQVTANHASTQGYSVQGSIHIKFSLAEDFKNGEIEIDGEFSEDAAPEAASAPAVPPAAAPAPPVNYTPAPSAPTTVTPRTTAQPRPNPAPAPRPALRPVLVVSGEPYAINDHSIVIGRSASTDIPVDDSGVSRQHIRVELRGGSQGLVTDLGSTNGTYVDGHKISAPTKLVDGSTITIGGTKIVFRLLPAKNGARP